MEYNALVPPHFDYTDILYALTSQTTNVDFKNFKLEQLD